MAKAVIFDLDGLMIDSERLALRAWNDMLASAGYRLNEEQYRHLVGRAHSESVRYVLEQSGVDIPFSVLDQGFWRRLIELIEQGLDPMPGLLPLLQEMSQLDVPLGVASNSLRAYVVRALEIIGVSGYFSCILAVDQVPHPKPAPDVYLAAAECLSISPHDCLAIEDSESGVRAALAAGMECILIPLQDAPVAPAEDVKAVYSSLNELRAHIGDLLGLQRPTPRP
jgi:HAD superfamily hydrolase (TIGR01509 family)